MKTSITKFLSEEYKLYAKEVVEKVVEEVVEEKSSIVLIDTLWVMIAAFFVFFMNAGFAFVEAGFCRAKNVVNILGKNFVIFAIALLAFWAVGYGLMFGEGNSFIGLNSFFLDESGNNPAPNLPIYAFFFFQATFAAA